MNANSNLIKILLGSICLSGLAVSPMALATARADEPATPKPMGWFSSKKEITGRVSARTDASLTVGSTLLAVTSATSITKNGQVIKLNDIAVGDNVKVTASTGSNDLLQAVAIEVLPAASSAGGS